jgi:hypothetical protein
MATAKVEVKKAEVIELAKELNSLFDLKISTAANVALEVIRAQIESNIPLLSASDFGESIEGSAVISEPAKATYTALGLKIPKAGKKAEEVVKTATATRATRAAKKTEPKKDKFTRSNAAELSIREMCKKKDGATLTEIVKRTDEIYVENGGNSVPDAINVNKYCLNGLVAFKVLTLKDGRYTFTAK